ncbi:radical SAM family heme chaperone HemW [Mongoliitalea daihaiensis]|uniref:radical SAM family heme chaperone HemW n=1 Tax=Mongoliitalea daihaiensis TaxID=2782006 RepID=UPI001F274603|nr:radical SAM family heme chaperone HemW [Mongoliitalea daihaiensis]UJP66273.1 radical SAM family heme chaperone HemW [Mongoliitalea daihaiensis]
MSGIYIHIPFCKQACHYCDFHFSTNHRTIQPMIDALIAEIEFRKESLQGDPIIKTIYFGGGTPSLLDALSIERILNAIYKHYSVALEECTLEANPDDIAVEKLRQLKHLNFDRLSIGIQSFNDQVLKFYNRAHSAQESMLAVKKSQDAGFEKLSIDLMYGFPHADHSIWKKDLETALTINPAHISSYCLTVEPKTALGKWTQTGKFEEADENFIHEQMKHLMLETSRAGYEQYEISNFAIPGKEAIHNSNYWKGTPYLGIGPSAHSFDGKSRWSTIANNNSYIRSAQAGLFPKQEEQLEPIDILNEYILTSLRTSWGTDTQKIKREYGVDLFEEKKNMLNQLSNEGMIIIKGPSLLLSQKGKFIADSIASALFIDYL